MRRRAIHPVFLLLFGFRLAGTAFESSDVRTQAQTVAAQPFQPCEHTLPEWLERLNYNQYRSIQFDSKQAVLFSERFFRRAFCLCQCWLIAQVTRVSHF